MKRALLTLLLLSGFARASPASDLFDEAAYWLALLYGGAADPGPRELVPEYRARLERACARQGDACGEAVAVETVAVETVRSLVAALDDGHTAYLPPEAFAQLQLLLGVGGSELGFGLLVGAPETVPGLVVLEVLPGSPAERTGLERGDRILSVDGAYLSAYDERHAALFAAEAAGRAELLLLRRGLPLELELTAEALPLDRLPTLTWPEEGVALLRVPSFLPPLQVAPEIHALVREAQTAGAAALVVDLRDNPGGAVTDCLAASGAFVPSAGRRVETPIMTQDLTYESGAVSAMDAGGTRFPQLELEHPATFTGPLAVLVNKNSASCAEFFALDLQ